MTRRALVLSSFLAFVSPGAFAADAIERPITIPHATAPTPMQGWPAVASNGHQYLVTWADERELFPADAVENARIVVPKDEFGSYPYYAALIAADGSFLTDFDLTTGRASRKPDSLFWSGTSWIVGSRKARVEAQSLVFDPPLLPSDLSFHACGMGRCLQLTSYEPPEGPVVTRNFAGGRLWDIDAGRPATSWIELALADAYDNPLVDRPSGAAFAGDRFVIGTIVGGPSTGTRLRTAALTMDGTLSGPTTTSSLSDPARFASNGSSVLAVTKTPAFYAGAVRVLLLNTAGQPIGPSLGLTGDWRATFWTGSEYAVVLSTQTELRAYGIETNGRALSLQVASLPAKHFINYAAGASAEGRGLLLWVEDIEPPYTLEHLKGTIHALAFSGLGSFGAAADVHIGRAAEPQNLQEVVTQTAEPLVVWRERDPATERMTVRAARVAAHGDSRDPEGIRVGESACEAFRVAAAGRGDQALIVWQAGSELQAARVSAAGEVLDRTPLILATGLLCERPVAATAAAAGSSYFVAWRAQEGAAVLNRAAVISTTGVLLRPSFVIASGAEAYGDPKAASDGTAFAVAINEKQPSLGRALAQLLRFDAAGLPIGEPSRLDFSSVDVLEWNGTTYVAVAKSARGETQAWFAGRISSDGRQLAGAADLPIGSNLGGGQLACASGRCTFACDLVDDGMTKLDVLAATIVESGGRLAVTASTAVTVPAGPGFITSRALVLPGGTPRMVYQRYAAELGGTTRIFVRAAPPGKSRAVR